MEVSRASIQADFDRIALVSHKDWNHNDHYHSFLLRQLPLRFNSALDVGCGTGAFSRLLAARSDQVLAIDLSPEMIRVARERLANYANIDFRVDDAVTCEFPAGQFDCVASIATMHHLPMESMLLKMKNALRANGTLIVLDLRRAEGLADLLTSVLAIPVSVLLRLARTGRLRQPREVKAAWDQHGKNDVYLTLSQARQACAAALPEAKVRQHLIWRYSIVWKK